MKDGVGLCLLQKWGFGWARGQCLPGPLISYSGERSGISPRLVTPLHAIFAAWTRCDLVGLDLIFFFFKPLFLLSLGNILSCWISHDVSLLLLTKKTFFLKCKWGCKIFLGRCICAPCTVTTIILPLPYNAFFQEEVLSTSLSPSGDVRRLKLSPLQQGGLEGNGVRGKYGL